MFQSRVVEELANINNNLQDMKNCILRTFDTHDMSSERLADNLTEVHKEILEHKKGIQFSNTSRKDHDNRSLMESAHAMLPVPSISSNMSLVDNLAGMHKEILDCTEEVKRLNKYAKDNECPSLTDSSLPRLPVKSMEEMRILEHVLENEEQRKLLVLRLSTIGGSQMRSVVNNMMNNTIDRAVAMEFSMHGKTNKYTFKNTNVYLCILGKCNIFFAFL